MENENDNKEESSQETKDNNAALKEELELKSKILEVEKQTQALKLRSGKSEAGEVKPKPKEETPQEYKDRIMRGQVNASN